MIKKGCTVKILAVDDSSINLDILVELLESKTIDVQTVETGAGSLIKIRENNFDAVLLDYRMPGMDGLDTLKAIRELDGGKEEVPVIIMTAENDESVKDMFIRKGATDFLVKPFSRKAILDTLRKYIKNKLDNEPDERDDFDDEACEEGQIVPDNVLRMMVENFIEESSAFVATLSEAYNKKDIDGYARPVHNMRTIGRLLSEKKLSGLATKLEPLARENGFKSEKMSKLHEEFIMEYCDAVKRCREKYEESEPKKILKKVSKDEINEAFKALREFNLSFDYAQMDETMSYLSGVELKGPDRRFYLNLKTAVYNIDHERIEQILKEREGE